MRSSCRRNQDERQIPCVRLEAVPGSNNHPIRAFVDIDVPTDDDVSRYFAAIGFMHLLQLKVKEAGRIPKYPYKAIDCRVDQLPPHWFPHILYVMHDVDEPQRSVVYRFESLSRLEQAKTQRLHVGGGSGQ